MKRLRVLLFVLAALLVSCAQEADQTPATPTAAASLPSATAAIPTRPSQTPTQTPVPATPTASVTPTPSYPPEGRGPAGFAPGVNPLTGLEVDDPQRLERRPIVIKVENIPREHRPQWGLSVADLVFEYYTEFGATRFAAVFYGKDAERVGPIRSGRFFDTNVVEMYKAVFVYGSAYRDVQNRFYASNFANRLILETNKSCPALCRTDPNGQNLLVADTTAMNDYLANRGVDNSRQDQEGMFFRLQPPDGGHAAEQVFLRYSGAIYNRWDYDAVSGRYLRFADAADDVNRNHEVYAQLTDRLTGDPVAAENVVTLCVPHQYYVRREDAEVLDIVMDERAPSYVGCDGQTYQGGSGPAFAARDGLIYPVIWRRQAADSALMLMNADGTPFPLKPGQTWFEVIGASSRVEAPESGSAWRFVHIMAP